MFILPLDTQKPAHHNIIPSSTSFLEFHFHHIHHLHDGRTAECIQDKLNPWMSQQVVLNGKGVVLKMFQLVGESAPFPNKMPVFQGNAGGSMSWIIIRPRIFLERQSRFGSRFSVFLSNQE